MAMQTESSECYTFILYWYSWLAEKTSLHVAGCSLHNLKTKPLN